jgi:Protein of unknown function (DUF3990)
MAAQTPHYSQPIRRESVPRLGPINIQLSLCRPLTDFGQGFYTTTWEHQAKEWANQQTRRLSVRTGATPVATVLRFDVDRDYLAAVEDLVFLRETTEFYDLVGDCRSGAMPHGRRPGKTRDD